MCLYANTKWDRIKEVLEKDGGIVKDVYQAYMSVGGFDSGLELNGAALHQLGKEASAYRNGERISLEGKWLLENAGFYDDVYDTKEEAIEALKKFAGKNAVKPKSKQIEFAVYQRRADNTLFMASASSIVWPGSAEYRIPISDIRAKAGCNAVSNSDFS